MSLLQKREETREMRTRFAQVPCGPWVRGARARSASESRASPKGTEHTCPVLLQQKAAPRPTHTGTRPLPRPAPPCWWPDSRSQRAPLHLGGGGRFGVPGANSRTPFTGRRAARAPAPAEHPPPLQESVLQGTPRSWGCAAGAAVLTCL